MQFCPYCNSTNRLGAQFCNTCGRSLPGPSLVCSRCRALITETDKFCHNCGARLSEVGRQFHTSPTSSVDTSAGTAAPHAVGFGSGTFVDAVEPIEEDPPATAAPSIPHRLEGSWQLIDSWVSKQNRPGRPADDVEKPREAAAVGTPQHATHRAIYIRGRVSKNQAIGIVAVLVAIAAILLWLGSGKR